MPIVLEDLQSSVAAQTQNAVKTYSPKFFSDILTGSGKKTGLLCEARNPINLQNLTTSNENVNTIKRKIINGDTTTHYIPMNVLFPDAWSDMKLLKRPDIADMKKVGTSNNEDVYLTMKIHSIVYEEKESKTGGKIKKITPCYQPMLFIIRDVNNDKHTLISDIKAINYYSKTDNLYTYDFTCNPLVLLNQWSQDMTAQNISTDGQAFMDFFTDFSLYTSCVERAGEWNESIDTILDSYFENAARNGVNRGDVIRLLKYVETYNIPLDLYRNIYNSVQKHFNKDDATEFCKYNLNLLLSDTLHNLDTNKSQLNSIGIPNPAVPLPTNILKWSNEQQKAITSPEPLILVQAGAGTGKSTVINGRMQYMINCGVKPEDITVLSFTNAAADHITELNPDVHSMTIARMIHSIYSTNFPDHELSSEKTLENCLDIYFPTDKLASEFKYKLMAVDKNDSNAFTEMNNFIEKNFDEVMKMLNTIKQTTLNLEIIICYQKIDTLIEPPEVQSKYLIIDEVQDNSIFEFIYTLKYVDKHKESLFIVGDCSQTLYEFRASNPKALNVLEGSGVFSTYQLQVNYRSNQEILDFANKALLNIEANQYANIQLQANSLAKVTEKTFRNKVHLMYNCLNKVTDFRDALGANVAVYCKPYIDECLARKEQVAVLAYRRADIYKIQESLKTLYPNAEIKNLIPERMFDSTIFSTFIKNYWNEVQFIPTKSIEIVVAQAIVNRANYLMYGDKQKNLKTIQRVVGDWRTQNAATIQSWQTQYVNQLMPKDEFFDNIKQNLLDFEISQNAIRQSLLSMRNAETKQQQQAMNANFVLSTVHSAKGLEFDNVIIIHKNDNNMAEDEKRMYYVAFTRAKNTEYILSYDTVKGAQIETDYKLICKQLHEQDLERAKKAGKVHNVIASGKTIEVIDDDFYNDDGTYATVKVDDGNN